MLEPDISGEVDDVTPDLPPASDSTSTASTPDSLCAVERRMRAEQPDVDHRVSEPLPHGTGKACECKGTTTPTDATIHGGRIDEGAMT